MPQQDDAPGASGVSWRVSQAAGCMAAYAAVWVAGEMLLRPPLNVREFGAQTWEVRDGVASSRTR